MEDRELIVNIERNINTFAQFHNLTYNTLKLAMKESTGRFHYCLITMVFCSFTLEAYLNHLGEKIINDWLSIERSLNPFEKLSLISETTSTTIDMQTKPFCFMNALFDYRKDIVHGKSAKLKSKALKKEGEIPELPFAKWEKMTNIENAKKFRKHTQEIIDSLSRQVLNEEYPLALTEFAFFNG
jgi:hypothetical protein